MNIDYVVISSDSNPLYRDFYEPVSRMWKHFGYKTFMIEICEEDSEIFETEFGIYKKIKSVCENTGLQAQTSRLFASKLIRGKNLLLSDIDMAPINISYFEERAASAKEDEITFFTGQPYGVNPFYPMCYVLAKSDILSKALEIDSFTFSEFIAYLQENYKGDTKWGTIWNTDENFLYDKMQLFENKSVLHDRNLERRINRTRWTYTEEYIKSGYYIDTHLLRPYSAYKNEIEHLFNIIIMSDTKRKNMQLSRIERIKEYISGEKFANIADYIFLEYAPSINNIEKNISKIFSDNREKVCIYTRPHYINQLNAFLHDNKIEKRIDLILHNSDESIDSQYIGALHRYERVFAQNVDVNLEKIISIPIGLENSYNFPEIGKIDKMKEKLNEDKKIRNLVYVNHYIPNMQQERMEVYNTFSKIKHATLHNGQNGKDFDSYLDNLYNHYFMACPRGNGIDTHRTWECLYLGTIPIEKRNLNNIHYEGKLPICFVDDWSEINEDFLIREYERISNAEWNFEILTSEYWKKTILSK